MRQFGAVWETITFSGLYSSRASYMFTAPSLFDDLDLGGAARVARVAVLALNNGIYQFPGGEFPVKNAKLY